MTLSQDDMKALLKMFQALLQYVLVGFIICSNDTYNHDVILSKQFYSSRPNETCLAGVIIVNLTNSWNPFR